MTPPSKSTLRIFVSHSHEDNEFGTKLVQNLRNALGSDSAVWYDASGGLYGGDSWWRKIVEELAARNVFIVVLSPNATESKWVNAEVDIAWKQKHSKEGPGKLIVPISYRSCKIRDDLDTLHIVSFLPSQTFEEAFKDLLAALELPANIGIDLVRRVMLQLEVAFAEKD